VLLYTDEVTSRPAIANTKPDPNPSSSDVKVAQSEKDPSGKPESKNLGKAEKNDGDAGGVDKPEEKKPDFKKLMESILKEISKKKGEKAAGLSTQPEDKEAVEIRTKLKEMKDKMDGIKKEKQAAGAPVEPEGDIKDFIAKLIEDHPELADQVKAALQKQKQKGEADENDDDIVNSGGDSQPSQFAPKPNGNRKGKPNPGPRNPISPGSPDANPPPPVEADKTSVDALPPVAGAAASSGLQEHQDIPGFRK
jgi:hypothetical protein